MAEPIDISENEWVWEDGLLDVLLLDRTTRKHIFWATDSYADYGAGYQWHDAITAEAITGDHGNLIMPRALKSRDEQQRRSRQMAEVFTPAWIVAEMNDVIDEEWSGEAEPNTAVAADADRRWQDYVVATRLEITCGEAPFLTSRYDTVTGTPIPLNERVGILDRKLRSVSEHAAADDWNRWALLALGSVYGYEWQGDNLLLAREALLASFNDYHEARFGRKADKPLLRNAAEIISWNIWQMDGLKAVLPDSCHEERPNVELSLFGESTPEKVSPCPGCAQNNILLHNGVRPQLRRWIPSDNEQPDHFDCLFTDFITKKFKTYHKTKWPMKFDFVIGNPPYQDESVGDNASFAPQIYNIFLDESFQISDKVEMIHPARFLFDAGSTPKEWNRKMLNDSSYKILKFYPDSSDVFPNIQLTGGVAISYHDTTKSFGAIKVFTPFDELNSIFHKVNTFHGFKSMEPIVITRTIYRLTDKLHEDFPKAKSQMSKGHMYDMSSNIFDVIPEVFSEEEPDDGLDYIKMLGRKDRNRTFMFIRRDYVNTSRIPNIDTYKVVLSKADGAAGTIGKPIPARIIGKSLIECPKEGSTESFISIGAFNYKEEAENCQQYLKTKFARTLISILKVTQEINPAKFKYVPLQNFTSSSDIDWSKSIHEIDEQLYDKYGLSTEERNFIETHVKEME
ncbi:Eco57I restriction-modification methylase domain-containing protein [Prevotella sp. AGR2160]|uniref:Eco57I restriction-modification methylase domain-containing protein n=1 Tax=Prevotella sp. AGR2160 TaxID=1280674 RepID=UPI000421397C|nr:Eco57I restriction-modification methylase domain-containing protein [Prevotella sp. AGR2160]